MRAMDCEKGNGIVRRRKRQMGIKNLLVVGRVRTLGSVLLGKMRG